MRKIKFFVRGLISLYDLYIRPLDKTIYGFCGKGVILQPPLRVCNPKNVFLEDDVNIFGNSNLIVSVSGKFIMKKKSGAAQGLTVVTANHPTNPDIGKWHKEVYKDTSTDVGSHVIIEEDVWIASNVTLLPNVVVGRGSQKHSRNENSSPSPIARLASRSIPSEISVSIIEQVLRRSV